MGEGGEGGVNQREEGEKPSVQIDRHFGGKTDFKNLKPIYNTT